MKYFLTIVLSFTMIFSTLAIPTCAAGQSVTVGAETCTFDTGSGAQGNITVRLKGGTTTAGKVEVLRESSLLGEAPGTVVIQRGDVLADNRENSTVLQVDFATISTIVGQTYSPVFNASDISNPTLTGVPQFNNFTIDQGVKLYTSNNVPLAYKVAGSHTVSGVLSAKWGEAGNGGPQGTPGANGQSVIIFSNDTIVTSSGIIAPYGGGGGGGSHGWRTVGINGVGYAGGNGGKGGDTWLYSHSILNLGLVTTGNGGGPGAPYTYWGAWAMPNDGWGVIGEGGTLHIFANTYSGTGKIATGLSGTIGEPVSSVMAESNLGGRGAGGGGIGYYFNGTSYSKNGNPGNYVDSGTFTFTDTDKGGTLTVPLNRIFKVADSGLTGFSSGAAYLTIAQADNLGTMGLGNVAQGSEHSGTLQVRVGSFPVFDIKQTARKSPSAGSTLEFNSPTTIKYGNLETYSFTANILAKSLFNVASGLTLNGTLQQTTQYETIFDGANPGNISIVSVGDVRFKSNENAVSTAFWAGRNTAVNGLRILRCQPAITTNDLGINTLSLDEWKTNYQSGTNGALPSQNMEFCIEKKTATDSTWKKVAEFSKSLASPPSWKDMSTIVGELSTYRVGYRNPGQTGYIFVENCEISGKSEGGGGLDETAPVFSHFSIANGESPVSKSFVDVTMLASDNRTTASELKLQIKVNNDYYSFDSTSNAYKKGDSNTWGSFNEKSGMLPLTEGNNFVVAVVKDAAGNKGAATASVMCLIGGEGSPVPNITPEELSPAITITTPLLNGAVGSETINGKNVAVVSSNVIELKFDREKLPANIRGMKYSISGDSYSAELSVSSPSILQLPPLSGIHMVKMIFISSEGLPSTIATPLYIAYDKESPMVSAAVSNGATITKNATVPVELIIRDDISQSFSWSTDLLNWSNVPIGGNVLIPMNTGKNSTKVYVKDSSGKTGFTLVKVWRMQ